MKYFARPSISAVRRKVKSIKYNDDRFEQKEIVEHVEVDSADGSVTKVPIRKSIRVLKPIAQKDIDAFIPIDFQGRK